ncbi:MAG: T9SS type A sorting domain-containing protein [Balneolaceae bacterium]
MERTINTGVKIEPNTTPSEYSLNQNYPNPFNPSTSISFSLPQSGRVQLEVYDITGRFITRLVDGMMGVGTHTVQFSGENIPSGVYIYTLKTEGYTSVRKMMLVK